MKKGKDTQSDEFYVGYKAEAPASYARMIRLFVGSLVVIIPLLAFVITRGEGAFSTSTFELGQLTQLEGVLTTQPVPMLKMELGTNTKGETIYQSVLLIGFGKFGAQPTITAMEAQHGTKLEGRKVKLEGTLIYHDGKTLMELTKKRAALIEVKEAVALRSLQRELGTVEITGEIADPKCFFGVMKPGMGKPHRSCAIRCISGGIPPVLKAHNKNQDQYFLLQSLDGSPINQAVLPYVGEGLKLKGQLSKIDDWLVLKIDPNEINRTTSFLLGKAPMCNPQGKTLSYR